MADILSPEEIEALLTSLSGEENEGESAAPDGGAKSADAISAQKERSRHGYEVYDFRRPDKFSKEQLRTLQMLHETFARLVSSSLAAMLRTPVHIELISVEQVPYEEYLRSINQSIFSVLSLAPLSGQAVMEMEFGLVYSMIDRMLGGTGKPIPRTTVTDIERPLVSAIVETALKGLKRAWEGIVIVHPRVEGLETSSQFVQIAPPTDIVVTLLFEIKMGDQRGAASLCIPYLVLKPITTKLTAQKWAGAAGRKKNPLNRMLLTNHVSRAKVDCKIELGTGTVSVREFVQLKPGDIVRIERKQLDDMLLHVEENPKFFGKPAKVGNKLAFQITGPYEP